jgi:2-iminobutanoate/2-iminopropanoate deaminase
MTQSWLAAGDDGIVEEKNMGTTIHAGQLYAEETLFAQGTVAGEFVFVAQDGRRADGVLNQQSAQGQARQTLENLDVALKTAGLDLGNIISLMVYLPEYSEARPVAELLDTAFGKNSATYPATTLVGVSALERGCRVRMDAVATSNRDRESFRLSDLPLAQGSRSHGVRVGNLVFLSGVDAADAQGNIAAPVTIQSQTREVLTRINKILNDQDLSLGDLCRTFMFMPSTDYRPGCGDARKEKYKGIFAEDEFPPNSGIYIRDLGRDILLRSVAIAYRGTKTVVASPKVRKAPGSFSQSIRVGDWLLLAGQDAVGFNREVAAEGDLAGQTEVTLQHVKDIIEEAGGTLDDVMKTTVYLIAGQDRSRFADAYREFFNRHRRSPGMPAGLTVEVRELSPRCLVEIDVVAFLGS